MDWDIIFILTKGGEDANSGRASAVRIGSGSVSPRTGSVNRATGSVNPVAGSVNPVAGSVSPSTGSVSPGTVGPGASSSARRNHQRAHGGHDLSRVRRRVLHHHTGTERRGRVE